MRTLLVIVSLAVALPAAPVVAQSVSDIRFSGRSGSFNHGGFGDHDRRRHRNDGVFIYDYYRDYQGDTAWRSSSFNDWWHDQPARSYPKWLQNNGNCQRQWYAGDTLRC